MLDERERSERKHHSTHHSDIVVLSKSRTQSTSDVLLANHENNGSSSCAARYAPAVADSNRGIDGEFLLGRTKIHFRFLSLCKETFLCKQGR